MTLQSSGAISLLDIRNELGLSGMVSLNDLAVRTLLGKASGQISLLDAYGKKATPAVSITNITSSSFNVTVSGNGTYFRLQLWLEWNGTMQTDNVYSYAGGYVAFANWYENSYYHCRAAVCDAAGNLLSPWATSATFGTLEWDTTSYGSQVSLPYSQTITMGNAYDVDTFWFYATSTTHTITFNATYSPIVSFDTYLQLYNLSGVLLFANNDTNGTNAAITATGLTIGNAYIVKARSNNFGSWGNGTLSIT